MYLDLIKQTKMSNKCNFVDSKSSNEQSQYHRYFEDLKPETRATEEQQKTSASEEQKKNEKPYGLGRIFRNDQTQILSKNSAKYAEPAEKKSPEVPHNTPKKRKKRKRRNRRKKERYIGKYDFKVLIYFKFL